ncbi:MAG: hypothetical protein M3Q73_04215 [bacterium]|nr:hypothetical protein [bacterium]
MKTWFADNWIKVVAIALLIGALNTAFPFVYFQVMNWVVVIAAVITVRQELVRRNTFLAWVFVAVAVLFNPIAPLYLRQDIWQIADLVGAALFLISLALSFRKPILK